MSALWDGLREDSGTQGGSEVDVLPGLPSGHGICGEACGLFLKSFYNNNATHTYHMHRPQKFSVGIFFSLPGTPVLLS